MALAMMLDEYTSLISDKQSVLNSYIASCVSCNTTPYVG